MHGSTLAQFSVRTQNDLGVYWLCVSMVPNERVFIGPIYPFSQYRHYHGCHCGHTVSVHVARQLCANHAQEAINMAAYGNHDYVVRLCYDNDKVDLDEVMKCTAGVNEVVYGL